MPRETAKYWRRYRRDGKDAILGEGRYGTVIRAVEKATGDVVAIKKIEMEESDAGIPSTAMRELTILRLLQGHPNIINLREVCYEYNYRKDKGDLSLVFECLSCDLRKYITSQEEPIKPEIIKSLTRQLCEGLYAMHSKGMFHRDLKPHNVLLDTDDPDAPILKIADFGLGRQHTLPIPHLTHEIGTLHYRAPEVLLGTAMYGHAVDMWSVGCIFAELFRRKPLFSGSNEFDQLLHIFQVLGTPTEETWKSCETLKEWHEFPQWHENRLKDVFKDRLTDDAYDLLVKLLTLDPAKRINIVDTLVHPYFDLEVDPELDESSEDGSNSAASESTAT